MSWGLKNRLSRIIQPEDGRTVMFAVDHGYFLGPTTGLEDCAASIMPLASLADALMLTRGVLRTSIDSTVKTPIVLRVSGGTSILDEDLSGEGITTSMEEALRMNAAGVALSIFVGAPGERETLLNLAKLVDEGERYGMPVLAVTAVGKALTENGAAKEIERNARYLGLACRIAAELGAHMVKTYYCEPDFEKVVACTPVPVVVAGGKKLPERDALELTHKAIQGGAAGVDMGRNIFQSDSPVGMIKAVRAIVHEDASVDDAMAIYSAEPKTRPA